MFQVCGGGQGDASVSSVRLRTAEAQKDLAAKRLRPFRRWSTLVEHDVRPGTPQLTPTHSSIQNRRNHMYVISGTRH